MKTTVDIPGDELADVMRLPPARTKRDAIVTASVEFNPRRRMAELTRRAGTYTNMTTADELERAHRGE